MGGHYAKVIMATALDFGSFSTAEKQALLTAAKARLLEKITGTVINGSSSSQSFGMSEMSVDQLQLLINALTIELGYAQPEIRVTPNFNGVAGYGYYDSCTS